MKAQIQILTLAMMAAIAAGAWADSTPTKESVRIDFNKMIDATAGDKTDLEKTMTDKMDHRQRQAPQAQLDAADADKQKVMDFVDVEINMGKDRPIVDRRFNSVGAPRVADHDFKLQLVSKK